ncbi:MAG: hypothetical protein FWF81_09375 [Defluviitaleaceae bacterium]|nr:hypothetical protein [Defluviitaleaceae bacterium]
MSGFNTSTDHTRNAKTDSIVYQDAFGNVIEVTLEQFLTDDPANTPAKFLEFKAFSDGIFAVEDKDARIRSKKEIPLYEWADTFASESLEAQLVERTEHEAHQAYLRRRKELRTLLPEAMEVLSEIQRRRLIMHKVEGLTTREIATREGVAQPTVVNSILGAEKKIKKFLRKKRFTS